MRSLDYNDDTIYLDQPVTRPSLLQRGLNFLSKNQAKIAGVLLAAGIAGTVAVVACVVYPPFFALVSSAVAGLAATAAMAAVFGGSAAIAAKAIVFGGIFLTAASIIGSGASALIGLNGLINWVRGSKSVQGNGSANDYGYDDEPSDDKESGSSSYNNVLRSTGSLLNDVPAVVNADDELSDDKETVPTTGNLLNDVPAVTNAEEALETDTSEKRGNCSCPPKQ